MFHLKEVACVCGAGCGNYHGLIITHCTHTLYSINLYSYCVNLKREVEGEGRQLERERQRGRKQEVRPEPSSLCGLQ